MDSLQLPLLVMVHALAVAVSYVSDCDETYNYWEPVFYLCMSLMCAQMHYMVHGSGFQTWEYSPAYAIRSYAYLLPHAAVARLSSFVSDNKVRDS
jgi:alpha-1,2-mannosyltransferase